MDYMTLKEASEKWAVTPLLLHCWPHSGSYKDCDNLVNSERYGQTR
jgi:hypothetical protein